MVAISYWTSPAGISKTEEVLKLLFYCSLGIFFYDTLLSTKFDWSIILGNRKRRWPQLLYFGTKFFFTIFLALITMFFWLESKTDCRAVLISIQWAMGSTVTMSSALLACRTVCVYSGRARTIILSVLLVFGAGLLAAWMHGVEDVPAIWMPAAASPWNSGACVPVNLKRTYYVKYIVTIIFDLLVLVLTTIGILRVDASSRIGDILIKHGVIYFVLTLIANLAVTILTALNLSPVMSIIAATPQSLICVIASTRLYRDLAEEASPSSKNHHVTSSQLTDSSRLSSFYKKRTSSRRAHDVIPVSNSWKQMTSQGSSIDAMEKGGTSSSNSDFPASNTMTGVHIQQDQVVTTVVEPGYLSSHPYNSSEQSSPESRRVQEMYPRLFHTGREVRREGGSPKGDVK